MSNSGRLVLMAVVTVQMLVCWQINEAIKRYPTQAQANCFPGCRCNGTAVECRNLKQDNTQLFRYIHPEAYPKLDTLIVTGNRFGVLEDENVFGGSNQRHTQLTLVNLSSNGISSFGAQTLIGIPRVEYLYLADNRLDSLEDVQPLNYLTSLKLLDLSRLFGQHISVNAKADLLRRLFNNNHSFVDLQEVILKDNGLGKLHPKTFCNIKGLTRLNLAHNHLSTFEWEGDCLESLHVLDLSHNQLQSVPAVVWKGLPSLDTIDVSSNPLQCTCELEDFHKFAVDEMNSFLNQEATTCGGPAQMLGQKVFELNRDLCPVSGRLWQWVIVVLVIAGLFFAYHRWGRGLKVSWLLEKWDAGRRSQNGLRVPLVDGITGYNQLKDDYDRAENPNVPPAFV